MHFAFTKLYDRDQIHGILARQMSENGNPRSSGGAGSKPLPDRTVKYWRRGQF